jgi:hypothetical protein
VLLGVKNGELLALATYYRKLFGIEGVDYLIKGMNF